MCRRWARSCTRRKAGSGRNRGINRSLYVRPRGGLSKSDKRQHDETAGEGGTGRDEEEIDMAFGGAYIRIASALLRAARRDSKLQETEATTRDARHRGAGTGALPAPVTLGRDAVQPQELEGRAPGRVFLGRRCVARRAAHRVGGADLGPGGRRAAARVHREALGRGERGRGDGVASSACHAERGASLARARSPRRSSWRK